MMVEAAVVERRIGAAVRPATTTTDIGDQLQA
jgi:hypothetical protein